MLYGEKPGKFIIIYIRNQNFFQTKFLNLREILNEQEVTGGTTGGVGGGHTGL